MLYGNFKNNSTTGHTVGGNDPFNKKKLAEEAKRDQGAIEQARKQREKSQLLLQVSNRKRELDQIKLGLRTKENLSTGLAREIEVLAREIHGLSLELNRSKNTVGALGDQTQDLKQKEEQAETRLKKVLSERDQITKDLQKLLGERNTKGNELKKLEAEVVMTERAESVETAEMVSSHNQELSLSRELAEKERALDLLKREIEAVKRQLEQIKVRQPGLHSKKNSITLDNQVLASEKVITDLDKQINNLQAEKIRLESEAGSLSRQITEEKNLENQGVHKEVSQLRDNQVLETSLKTKERRLIEIESRQEEMSKEIAKVKAEIALKEKEIQDLTFQAGRL